MSKHVNDVRLLSSIIYIFKGEDLNEHQSKNSSVLEIERTNIIFAHFERHFNSEDTGEDIVKIVENVVAVRFLYDRVLCRQGYAACTDHDHDEQVKVSKADHKVAELANAVKYTRNHTAM